MSNTMSFSCSNLSVLLARTVTMSSQTSDSRFQTPLQSRAVCSHPSVSSSLHHQNRSLAPTNHPSAPKKMAPAYFEEFGLHVPLRKFGQNRLHARSASELSGKNRQALLDIAKDITNGQVSKMKSASRGELALFIERVETLALGPHPKTTLPSTKTEDLVEALGLKAKAQKPKVKKDAPRQKPASKKDSPFVESRVIAQSTVPFSTKKNKPHQDPVPVQQATSIASPPEPRAAPKSGTAQRQISHHTLVRSAQATQKTSKRKYDSADGPADEQTVAKKTRIVSTPSSKAFGLPQVSATIATKAPLLGTAPRARLTIAEQEGQSRSATPAPASPAPSPAASPRVHEKPNDNNPSANIDCSPCNVTHGSDPDIAISHTKPLTNDPPAHSTSPPTNTPNSPTPHSPPNQHPLPHLSNPPSDKKPASSDPTHPFLKPGVHGRGGDFKHDPDRATGRGHQVEPQDLARKRAYDALYRTWKWRVGEAGEGMEEVRTDERMDELSKEEEWMGAYRDKYPGEVVGHLWDCGCEMVGDGEESEEE